MIPVQFIIQASVADACLKQAEVALQAGCKWIELHTKCLAPDVARDVAARLLKLCHECEATMCVADNVQLCKEVGADGIILTTEACAVNEVREALGHEFLIGAKATCFEQVKLLKRMSADYVNICVSNGIEGLLDIKRQVIQHQLRLPLCVSLVEGLSVADAKAVIEAGADGIAISDEVVQPNDLEQTLLTLLHLDDALI